jgi:hypothetical protein
MPCALDQPNTNLTPANANQYKRRDERPIWSKKEKPFFSEMCLIILSARLLSEIYCLWPFEQTHQVIFGGLRAMFFLY